MKEAVQVLLGSNADVFMKNQAGKLASEEAFDRDYVEVCELLMDKEMSTKHKDNIVEEIVESEDMELDPENNNNNDNSGKENENVNFDNNLSKNN